MSQAKILGLTPLSETGPNAGCVCLDVTVKLSTGIGRLFAPTWDMVCGVKGGLMPVASYSSRYRDIYLAAQVSGAVDRLLSLAEGCERMVLLCFCPDGRFCHTGLLCDWLSEHLASQQKF